MLCISKEEKVEEYTEIVGLAILVASVLYSFYLYIYYYS